VSPLRDYCLSEHHARGRHRARVFASVLGLSATEADVLREALLRAACEEDATEGERDEYGQRYVVNFEMSGPRGRAKVRSLWIVLHAEEFPRMVTCYVL